MNPCERPILEMARTADIACIIFCTIASIVSIWYATKVAKKGNVSYPLWIILGTLLSTVYETQDALLGHFVYPQIGQITAYSLHDRPLPVFLILTFIFYVGPMLIFIFDRMEKRTLTPSLWWKVYLASVVGALFWEPVWIHYGCWYYWGGNQPLKVFGLPIWWIFVNPAAIMCMGVFCYLIWRDLLLRQQSYLLFIFVPLSLYAFHGAIGAPVTLALGTFKTQTGPTIATGMTTALSFFAIWTAQKVLQNEINRQSE